MDKLAFAVESKQVDDLAIVQEQSHGEYLAGDGVSKVDYFVQDSDYPLASDSLS